MARRRRTQAQRADKYVCYQRSVQEPSIDVLSASVAGVF
jgi:hypothetical protein